MSNEQATQGYMAQSTMLPNSLDGLFKPLGEHVRKDIQLVVDTFKLSKSNKPAREAFNRLMAELHVTTESSTRNRDSSEAYRSDLNNIDAVLKEIGFEYGGTANNVAKLVSHTKKANKVLEELLNVSRKI